jgi:hypothetical protein
VPFCASCGWQYIGEPRFCRECGRPILRRVSGGRALDVPASLARTELRVVDPVAERARQRRDTLRRRVLVGSLALLAGIAFLLTGWASSGAALSSLPADEAWVRLVYARNLAQTAQLEFNTGQREPGVGSVLWVLTMAGLVKTLGAIGLNVIALAKGVSLLAAAAAAILAGELAARLTSSRAAGLAGGVLVALDPTFGFAGVAGVEATLLAALVLGACLAVVERHALAVGLLTALAVLASLEGLVLIPFVAAAVLWPLGRGLRLGARPDGAALRAVGLALGPPLAAMLIWLWIDAPPNGVLPSEVYVARATKPGLPLPDVAALWHGYFEPSVGHLGAGAWLVAVPAMLIGAYWLAREHGWRAAPAIAFAPLVALGIAAFLPLPRDAWTFALRRHLDATLPFLAVLLVVGVRAVWLHGRELVEARYPVGSRRRPTWALATVAAPLIAAAIPVAGLGSLWQRLPHEYAAAAQVQSDTYFALARHVRDSVAEEALVAAAEPGAIRYVSRRPVADLSGTHTPVLAGRPPLDALVEARAELAALPRTRLWDSAPGATLVREFSPVGGDLVGPRLGLFRLTLGASTSARDGVYAFPTERLTRLDYVDVGNEAAEREHTYQVAETIETLRRTMRVTAERAVADDGRVWRGAEAVALRAEPGRDLVVARRFDGFAPGGFSVSIDGQPFGEWWPRAGAYGLAEDAVRIPGRLVRGPRAVVRLELIGGSAPSAASFGYWSFANQP